MKDTRWFPRLAKRSELKRKALISNEYLLSINRKLYDALKEAVGVLEARAPDWEQTHFRNVLAEAERGIK